jgi:magnesium transporter
VWVEWTFDRPQRQVDTSRPGAKREGATVDEASYTQNEEIKKISAWAAIFFAPTLIGTVYGMNFDHMPELHWVIGYPLALLPMVLVSVGLYLMFKRRKWL